MILSSVFLRETWGSDFEGYGVIGQVYSQVIVVHIAKIPFVLYLNTVMIGV